MALLSGCGADAPQTPSATPTLPPVALLPSVTPAPNPPSTQPQSPPSGATLPESAGGATPPGLSLAPNTAPVSEPPREIGAPQNQAPLASELSPPAFVDDCATQVRAAQNAVQLEALNAKFKDDERQFTHASRTGRTQVTVRVALMMRIAMQILQRAVAAKQVELSGQNPKVQPPFIGSERALEMARSYASGANFRSAQTRRD